MATARSAEEVSAVETLTAFPPPPPNTPPRLHRERDESSDSHTRKQNPVSSAPTVRVVVSQKASSPSSWRLGLLTNALAPPPANEPS